MTSCLVHLNFGFLNICNSIVLPDILLIYEARTLFETSVMCPVSGLHSSWLDNSPRALLVFLPFYLIPFEFWWFSFEWCGLFWWFVCLFIYVQQHDVVSYINDALKEGTEISSFRKDAFGRDGTGTSYWWFFKYVTVS
jgi:hypothetical protein